MDGYKVRMRHEELDSLRAIAALIVVFFHMQMIIPDKSKLYTILSHTPLRIIITGNESVIFFLF